MGGVLVAESRRSEFGVRSSPENAPSAECRAPNADRLGYCISRDRYLKRDELGVIYQLCVDPSQQRGYVGAALIREVFNRSAYGCRLYCCWCAQDLEANYFWESLGFVPIAFRAGSGKKKRVHIFWQKRIDSPSESITTHQSPFWYPSKTDQGALRADRLVFPIPPGLRWSDEMPVIVRPNEEQAKVKREMSAKHARLPVDPPTRHGPRQFGGPSSKPLPAPVATPVVSKRERPKKQAARTDPKLIAAARELRDRWLEKVNEMPALPVGKYEVTRALEAQRNPQPLLEAA
jgi:hypothetical protein